ncbi:DUF1576 domain-containing protein [Candidatus Izemoplasma sp. B36]|uniref:DUF1576 domain-containing protein n=1 Tax=Candidatus Izemoplasma sp. B36 TaxID=3242468 RepID=UPI0035570D83
MNIKLKQTMLVPYIAILLMILAFVFSTPMDLLVGLKEIYFSKSNLLTDYIQLAGLGPTLLNSSILVLFSYAIVRMTKTPISGPVFAGLMTILGFSFFGKNLLNSSIIFFGVFLYAIYKKISLRSVIVVLLFSSGLAPISSVIMFGLELSLWISIPLGIIVGIFSGFILMELAPHVIKFHNGYDLYNVGFAGGILAIVAYSFIKLTNSTYHFSILVNDTYHYQLLIISLFIVLVLMIVGFIANGKTLDNYKHILKKSGRSVTDFTRKNREGIALFNSGLTGLIVITTLLVLGIKFTAPAFGGIMTVIGFGCFGKHPKNIIPPLLGVILVVLIFGLDFNDISITLAIIFSTALAPISGEYGIVVGLLTGMLHLPIVSNISNIHGGIILYSNGFAAAFTAVVVHMIMVALERSDKPWQFMKSKKTSK